MAGEPSAPFDSDASTHSFRQLLPSGNIPVPTSRRNRRVPTACDFCKRRKVKCDGKQPCEYCCRKGNSNHCIFSAPKKHFQVRSVGNTPNTQSRRRTTNSTPPPAHSRSRSETVLHQPRTSSPAASRDDYEDTVVPLEGRILRDAQGKVIFIGDSAPLSFLQTVRHLISSEVDPGGYSVPAARDCIIENARPTTADRSQDVSISLPDVPHLVGAYLVATNGLVDLFQRGELLNEMKIWANGTTSHSEDSAAAVFYLVLAIGAQEDQEAKADAWFQHARDILLKSMCNSMNIATVQGFALVSIYMLRSFQPNGAYLYFSLAARTSYAIGLHRTEVNASFGDPVRTVRDRIWKSLRVVDMLISTNLGRPPSTSDVDCTVKYSVAEMDKDMASNILDASVQIFMIIERVVVEVYSRKRISLRIAEFVSRQLKGWASNWLQILTDVVSQSHPDDDNLAQVALVGACSTLCSYYYGIMLLTRPFLIYEIYEYMGATMRNTGTQSDHQSKRKYANAALDAAISFVDTLETVERTGALPRKMPLIVSWLFTASLVLAVGTLGRSGSMFVENCEASIRCLDHFSSVDPHARQYSLIVQSLLKLMTAHAKKREKQMRLQSKQASSELFGLLPPDVASSLNSDEPRVQPASEPDASYAPDPSATATAPMDWTIYDADFFALPWPTEYDPALQDFLQPGTHTSDGASVADIPLFPMYDQQSGHGFH